MDTENLLTVQQAARLLGVDDNAVRIATKEGRLPYTHALGRKVIHRADLESYRQRTQPGGAKSRGRPAGSKNNLKIVS